MNKKDLINAVAEKTGMTKKDSGLAVEAAFEAIQESLAEGIPVKLIGFGSWSIRERAERKARNPQTGEELTVPKHNAVAFKAGKKLKDSVR